MSWAAMQQFWPVLIPVAAWLVLAIRGPRTRWVDEWPSNATNYWHGLIVMRRSAPRPETVWAQEFYEVRRKLRRPWETVLRVFLSDRRDWLGRNLELMGHEIEVQSAVLIYGGAASAHRRREARALARYDQFDGWTVSKIEKALSERAAAARAFVEDHEKRIRSMRPK